MKTALITGSTSGIGRVIAEKLASQDYNIVINGFGNLDEINQQIDYLENSYRIKALYYDTDLTDVKSIEEMIHDLESKFDSLDVIVNNAAVQHVAKIEEFPVDKWDKIISLNLSSAFHIIRLTLPAMKKRGWGRIINIASAHALVASPFKSAYVAAKHGLAGLTKVVALESAAYGVTCNAICPGYVLTPLVEGQIASTAKARNLSEEEVIQNVILGSQPTKKFTTVEDIAALTSFLCSLEANNITGSMISIDGGWTCQ